MKIGSNTRVINIRKELERRLTPDDELMMKYNPIKRVSGLCNKLKNKKSDNIKGLVTMILPNLDGPSKELSRIYDFEKNLFHLLNNGILVVFPKIVFDESLDFYKDY